MRAMRTLGRLWWPVTTVVAVALSLAAPPALATPGTGGYSPRPTYRADDFAAGQAMDILPAGENGLVNVAQFKRFEKTGQRPPHSQDQLAPYENLEFGYRSLTDSALGQYYLDESFGVRPGQIIATEHPSPAVPVVIYRDRHDIPHIYGATNAALAFGAGYAQAQDRLFLMDVLRHYGSGTLTSFLGPSCADEQMDHDELLLAPYTTAQANAQINSLPREYGAQGRLALAMIHSYVQGINAYIAKAPDQPRRSCPSSTRCSAPPKPWTPADVVAVASLIGGIFGDGGGGEVRNAALLQYLQGQLGRSRGSDRLHRVQGAERPGRPDDRGGQVVPLRDPAARQPGDHRHPRPPRRPAQGRPGRHHARLLGATGASRLGLSDIEALLRFPSQMSNALVVGASHSADGHPIAVFGPQVSYFAPGILMQEDLHSPSYDAEGASFPGTGFVELGRGVDYAWSATSAGSDLTDQRLELICNPNGGPVSPTGTFYMFRGKCIPMVNEQFADGSGPVPQDPPDRARRGPGLDHGPARQARGGGQPALHLQPRRGLGDRLPALGAARAHPQRQVVDDRGQRGRLHVQLVLRRQPGHRLLRQRARPGAPLRRRPQPADVGHRRVRVAGIPARLEARARDRPAAGILRQLEQQAGARASPRPTASTATGPCTGCSCSPTRSGTSSRCTTGRSPGRTWSRRWRPRPPRTWTASRSARRCSHAVRGRHEPAGVRQMLAALRVWYSTGAHRILSAPGDAQYEQAAAVAISDQLTPAVIRAIFDPVFAAGGVTSGGYKVFPMGFVNEPFNGGAHLGSAYDGGWEGYTVKALDQMTGKPRRPAVQPRGDRQAVRPAAGCGSCGPALDAALEATYQALVKANGGSTNVPLWTADANTAAAGLTMPQYDAIGFQTLGIVGQPDIPWQNRPTFQQVVSFPAHRPR